MAQPPPSTPDPKDQPEGEPEETQIPSAPDAEEPSTPAPADPPSDESIADDSEAAASEPTPGEAAAAHPAYQGQEWNQPPPKKVSLARVGLITLLALALVFSGGVVGYFLFKPDQVDSAVEDADIDTPTETPDPSEDDADEEDSDSSSGPDFDVSFPELSGPWEEYDIEDPQTPSLIYSENWIIEVADGWVAVAHFGLLDRALVNYNAEDPEGTVEYVADNFVADAFWAQSNLQTTEIEFTDFDIDGTESAVLAEFRASWDNDGGIFDVPDEYEDIAILLADINGRDAVMSIVGIPESENDRYDETIDLFEEVSVS